jgi:hypothetical protein
MLGESLLVAPVFSPRRRGRRTTSRPGAGRNLMSGATLEGPGWIKERHDFSSLPLLVRPGSVIAMGARSDRADYDFADGVTLRAYELAEGVKVAVAVPDIARRHRFRLRGDPAAGVVVAERVRGSKPWRLLLVNAVSEPGDVTGGAAENTPEGMLVTAAAGSHRIEIRLRRTDGGPAHARRCRFFGTMQPGSCDRQLEARLAKGDRQAMKFSDGYWRMRPGSRSGTRPRRTTSAESTDALTIYAPTGRSSTAATRSAARS